MGAAYDLLNKTRAGVVTVFSVFRMYPRQIAAGSDRFKRESFVTAVESRVIHVQAARELRSNS